MRSSATATSPTTPGSPAGRGRSGSLLAGAGPDVDVPWWRVVRSDGRIATDPAAGQAALLRAEGVTVRAGRVVDAPIGRFRRPLTRHPGAPSLRHVVVAPSRGSRRDGAGS